VKHILCLSFVVLSLSFRAATPPPGASDARKVDRAHSKITVRVFKSGFFSALAHNHEIEAPLESGEVNESGSLSAELRIDARKLRVLDPEASMDTRANIQETMLGQQVLDADRFPEIHFKSTAAEPHGPGRWLVQGNLDLHGQTHPVVVEVTLREGVYRGTAVVKQTDFGIRPIRIAGGTVNVKDEIKIEFEIALSQ
jgi:polyisoprenoid-binding protein YceI